MASGCVFIRKYLMFEKIGWQVAYVFRANSQTLLVNISIFHFISTLPFSHPPKFTSIALFTSICPFPAPCSPQTPSSCSSPTTHHLGRCSLTLPGPTRLSNKWVTHPFYHCLYLDFFLLEHIAGFMVFLKKSCSYFPFRSQLEPMYIQCCPWYIMNVLSSRSFHLPCAPCARRSSSSTGASGPQRRPSAPACPSSSRAVHCLRPKESPSPTPEGGGSAQWLVSPQSPPPAPV